MSLESILMLRQSAGVDTIRGYALISIAFLLLMGGFYCYWIARIERKQSKAQLRKELAERFVSYKRQTEAGAWRSDGAGAKNERGAW